MRPGGGPGAAGRCVELPRGRGGVGDTTVRAVVAGTLVLFLSGCASTVPIGELMDDPMRHDGREVTVRGEVQESLGFLGPGIYRLRDDSGSLPVVSQEGGAPRSGSEVRVTGTFRAAFTVADRSLAVLLESRRENP